MPDLPLDSLPERKEKYPICNLEVAGVRSFRTPFGAPKRIRVGFHRQAKGITKLLLDPDETLQADLWDVHEFRRTDYIEDCWAAYEEVTS